MSADRPPTPLHRGRLRRSDCSGAGLHRTRRGRGFSYEDETGQRIEDPEVIDRLRTLAIPPAWKDVWICPDPLGHLQATGVDGAGRKQYLYHPRWREHRDRQKFDKMLRFGAHLPDLRRELAADLRGRKPTRERVLAAAVRLLDVGVFRIGSEEYADDEGGIGLATIRKEHVTIHRSGEVEFDYLAKGGVRRRQVIDDPLSRELLRTLKRRRSGGPLLLAYRRGDAWEHLRSDEINDYLKDKLGEDFSAKDFRTWSATVAAAVSLAAQGRAAMTKGARKRAMDRAARDVSELLGNTPAVARRAYIDPRVFDRYQSGWLLAEDVLGLRPGDDEDRAKIESAVIDLLSDNRESPAVQRLQAEPQRRAA